MSFKIIILLSLSSWFYWLESLFSISLKLLYYLLSLQVIADKVHYATKDEDVILDNGLFEDRHTFLDFCHKNRYQFDTLRRAKHSSMMVLHHLRNSTVSTLRMTCSVCHTKAAVDPRWICELCPEFDVCAACYQEKGGSCHVHKLTQYSSTPTRWVERKEARGDVLLVWIYLPPLLVLQIINHLVIEALYFIV